MPRPVGGNRGHSDASDGTKDSLLGEADALGYRRRLPGFSTNARAPSANDPARQGFSQPAGLTGGMDRIVTEGDPRRLPDLGIALKSILAFWLLYMSLITLRALILQYPDFWAMLARRSAVVGVGVVLTFLVYLAMRPVAKRGLNTKSIVFSAANYYAFYVYAPLDAVKMEHERNAMGWSPLEMFARSVLETSLSWYFIFAAWAAFYVAMSYARQLRAADRHAASLAREAQEAQLRALRYQINPHFLFNTLNSLSSLCCRRRPTPPSGC
jgi:hypothetical protein